MAVAKERKLPVKREHGDTCIPDMGKGGLRPTICGSKAPSNMIEGTNFKEKEKDHG